MVAKSVEPIIPHSEKRPLIQGAFVQEFDSISGRPRFPSIHRVDFDVASTPCRWSRESQHSVRWAMIIARERRPAFEIPGRNSTPPFLHVDGQSPPMESGIRGARGESLPDHEGDSTFSGAFDEIRGKMGVSVYWISPSGRLKAIPVILYQYAW
jgi:hypothetical protein